MHKSKIYLTILITLMAHLIFTDTNINKYRNIAKKTNKKVAVLVIAYNRPYYFEQSIKAIEQNSESKYLPFFFILDGGPKATQAENCDIISKSSIKKKYIIKRKKNYGCGKNIIDARRFIFDWCNFNIAIVIEDDLIITPQYLTLVLNLYKWSKKHYDNIGAVQCYSNCHMDLSEKRLFLNKIEESGMHEWWGYCMDKSVWDKIKDTLYTYEKNFLQNKKYKDRNHKEIRDWITSQLVGISKNKLRKTKRACKIKREFTGNINHKENFLDDDFITGQDGITYFALWKAGYTRTQTAVNRAVYIGINGIHSTSKVWHDMGYHKLNYNLFNNDSNLINFSKF